MPYEHRVIEIYFPDYMTGNRRETPCPHNQKYEKLSAAASLEVIDLTILRRGHKNLSTQTITNFCGIANS
jgi:hypothetical protein